MSKNPFMTSAEGYTKVSYQVKKITKMIKIEAFFSFEAIRKMRLHMENQIFVVNLIISKLMLFWLIVLKTTTFFKV